MMKKKPNRLIINWAVPVFSIADLLLLLAPEQVSARSDELHDSTQTDASVQTRKHGKEPQDLSEQYVASFHYHGAHHHENAYQVLKQEFLQLVFVPRLLF